MFLKGSLGGHHILVRIAIGIAAAIVLAIAVLVVLLLARRTFTSATVPVAPAMHVAGHGLQTDGSARRVRYDAYTTDAARA